MRKCLPNLFVFIALLVFMSGWSALSAQDITFTQPDSNLGITSTIGQFGCAWGDYNGDGYMDLLVSGRSSPHILYRNDNGVFTNVSAEAFTDNATAQGAIWGDFDNDGDLDLFTGQGGVHLYRNDDGVFTDISTEAGISTYAATYTIWGVTAADYDMDGDLDVAFAGGNSVTAPGASAGPAYILQNNDMVFSDVAIEILGFSITLESWNPQWVDINNDGLMDLWLPTIRTPLEPCALFINEESGSFSYIDTTTSGLNAKSAISSCWGDYDNDGDLDVFITPFSGDTAGNSRLYSNEENYFVNVSTGTPLDSAYANSRGACFGDYDNDGDQDLVVGRLYGQTEKLFRNDGTTWTDVSVESGVSAVSGTYRGAMFIDYDNDGFLDIFFNEATKILLHNPGNQNHWIAIKPKGVTNNTAGIGARIRAVTGSLKQIRYVQAGAGGMTQGFLWPHFGLGANTTVDSLIVTWPNGVVDVAINVAADNYYTFVEGIGISGINEKPQQALNYTLKQNYPNPFNPLTTIEFTLPVKSEVRLVVSNILGEVVEVLAAGDYAAGNHTIRFNAVDLSAGIYFYSLQADQFSQVKKLVLLK